MADNDVTTIRDMIEALTELAAMLPDAERSEVEFGICNGTDLQMVDKVDVSHYTHVRDDGGPDRLFVMFRGHVHPGEKPGRLLRDAVADVDEELRGLRDDPDV